MSLYANDDETIAKLKAGEHLTEKEIMTLICNGYEVDEIEGESGRWTKCMTTIIDVDGQLYAIDWYRGLTEYQENEYYSQPYKVNRVEKVVTRTEIVYEAVEE